MFKSNKKYNLDYNISELSKGVRFKFSKKSKTIFSLRGQYYKTVSFAFGLFTKQVFSHYLIRNEITQKETKVYKDVKVFTKTFQTYY